MDRNDAVAIIKEGLGFTTQRDDAIVTRLKQAQRLLEQGRSLPWFLIEEDASFPIVADDDEYDLPTGFLREVFRKQFHYTDTSEATDRQIFLEKVTLEEGLVRFTGDDDAKPLAYTLRKDSVKFYPVPDDAYTLYWDYYKAADVLDSNIENVWLEKAPDVLIGSAGILIAQDLANVRAEEKFQKLFNAAWAGVFAEGIERDDENDPVYIGGRL